MALAYGTTHLNRFFTLIACKGARLERHLSFPLREVIFRGCEGNGAGEDVEVLSDSTLRLLQDVLLGGNAKHLRDMGTTERYHGLRGLLSVLFLKLRVVVV